MASKIIVLKSAATVRLSADEAKEYGTGTEVQLKRGQNRIPEALADHWYVRRLIEDGSRSDSSKPLTAAQAAAQKAQALPEEKPVKDPAAEINDVTGSTATDEATGPEETGAETVTEEELKQDEAAPLADLDRKGLQAVYKAEVGKGAPPALTNVQLREAIQAHRDVAPKQGD